jgi:hydrogenase expression/formation protein HypC
MCLAVPGKVAEWLCRDGVFATAWVEFGGVRRRVCMACTPAAQVDDYVLVHAGVAIGQVDALEANRVLRLWAELEGDREDWVADDIGSTEQLAKAEELDLPHEGDSRA